MQLDDIVWDNDDLVMHVTPEMLAKLPPERRRYILDGLKRDFRDHGGPRRRIAEADRSESPPARSSAAKLTVRLPRELHEKVRRAAAVSGVSVNAYVLSVVATAVGEARAGRR